MCEHEAEHMACVGHLKINLCIFDYSMCTEYVYIIFYSDEEAVDEDDDSEEDDDPAWREYSSGEDSGGRGRSPIRQADSPSGPSGSRGRGGRARGGRARSGRARSGRARVEEAGVEGAGVEGAGVEGAGVEGVGPRRTLAHNRNLFMMRTLGIPSLPFNQVVRQGFILIGMSSGE